MLEFITKYWLQVLFGLIATGLGFLCKKFYTMYKKEKADHEQTTLNELYLKTQNDDKKLDAKINKLNDGFLLLKDGLLSIQGHQFRQKCKKLLNDNYEITLEEFDQIIQDHDTYKALGGNHEGDILFNLVEIKYRKHLEK